MIATLMMLALSAAPAADRDDPELAAEEAKAIRKELITVRAELRRLAAREEALKVRRTLGLEDAEVREALSKDPRINEVERDIRDAERRMDEVRMRAGGALAEDMKREISLKLVRMREQRDAYTHELRRVSADARLAEQRAYLTALEKLLLADLKRLTGR